MQPEEMPEVRKEEKCCLNCKWHDERTGFCRFCPPSAVQAFIKGLGTVNQTIWPKPPLPNIDWCSNFKNKHSQII